MDAIFNVDASILLWIQDALRAPFATPVVSFITHLGDHGIFWVALTLALLAFRRTRRIGLVCFVSMAIGWVITNLVIKNWVARVRPYELIEGLECLVGTQKDFSFPSGHTTNALACAWVLLRMAPKKYGVPAMVLAVLIALSRLYVGVHYPTDVLGGAVIGIASAIVALAMYRRFGAKLPEKWFGADALKGQGKPGTGRAG